VLPQSAAKMSEQKETFGFSGQKLLMGASPLGGGAGMFGGGVSGSYE